MADLIREIEAETFERQSEIIGLQADAIHDLIMLLRQHGDVDDADFAPAKEKIDHAARIRAEMNL